ncbi:MAG: OmpH family outer membrane protein [Crocinitomicaceae bacterium]|nr:OmpH family outer membrane protein [Crocinitomicaceae bacterium]
MQIKRLVITSVIMSFLSMIGVGLLLVREEEKKTAFFMSAEVYNEFDYKKELEQELSLIENDVRQSVDSLERDLKLTLEYLKSISPTDEQLTRFEMKQNYFFQYKQTEEGRYSEKAQEYYGLIWDRINGYVQEYGKDNDYVYIFGANGDGSVMYADDNENITEDLIAYVNSKYAGE